MRVELGSKLVALADPNQGGDMLTRFATVRAWLASDLGILLPMVRVADRASLPEYDYEIQLFGNRIANGQTRPGKLLAVDRGRTTGDLDGQLVKEPATGDAAVWIDASQKQQAAIYGYEILEPSEVIAQHVKHVARKHAAELLTRDATKQLIDQLRKSAPALVDELIPEVFKLSEIQAVLQGLLDEDIPIRQLGTILEAMADVSHRTRHAYRQVEHVRSRLARTISLRYRSADSKLWVATLPVSIEEQIRNGYEFQDDGIQVRMTPASVEIIAMQIRRQLTQLKRAGHRPILLVNPQIRKASHSIVTQTMPDVIVLSYAEITSDTTVEAIGNAELTRMSKAS
jgi:flagellar biosynthesis protein FlhA